MSSFIPAARQKRIDWAKNFKMHLPAIAADYGISEEKLSKALAACDTIIFTITLAREAKLFAKVCTRYRDGVLSKQVKEHTIPTMAMPTPPPVIINADPIGYLRELAGFIKVQSKYSAVTGSLLRIVAPSASFASLTDAQPKGKTKSLSNSVVRIDWTKGKAHGVIIESQRGAETVWTTLDRDMYSPYIDTRPPLVAGKPEERRYRLRYFFNDEPIGEPSQIWTAITLP